MKIHKKYIKNNIIFESFTNLIFLFNIYFHQTLNKHITIELSV